MYVRIDGPTYTRKGENEAVAQQKAYGFKKNWVDYLEHRDPGKISQPDFVESIAWTTIEGLFSNATKLVWARRLHTEYDLDLLACTEEDILHVLDTYIFDRPANQKGINKISSIADICSTIRGIFRDIGREYAWGDRQDFTIFGQFLMNSGNPMTTGTENELKKKLRSISVRVDPEKKGGVVSAPLAYVNIVWHLAQLVAAMHKWGRKQYNQVERIENLAYLVMIFAFCMHEGCRYKELVEELTFQDLYLPLHANVYFLTVALLDIEVLAYLLLNNKLSFYVMSLFKGKKVKAKHPRMKAVIPAPYNSLDLLTIWVFCMRCILTVNPDGALRNRHVIKQKARYSEIRVAMQGKMTKAIGVKIQDLTFYSNRYSGAFEDQRAHVDETWTEYRMGHKPKSQTKEKYASNKIRVRVDTEDNRMGMDLYEEATYTTGIILSFLPMASAGSTLDTTWLDTAFAGAPAGYRENFDNMTAVVDGFVRTGDSSNILAKFKQTRDISWMARFPMGFHINFPEELMTHAMKKVLDAALDTMVSGIDEVAEPRFIPELWSSPQVMYGDWRGLLSIDGALAKPPLAKIQKSVARKRPRLVDTGADTGADDTESDSDGAWDDGYDLNKIEKGDHVVLFCDKPGDKCALALPGSSSKPTRYIFVATVRKMKKGDGKLTISAKFYYNTEKDATNPLLQETREQRMEITEQTVLNVFAAAEGEVITELLADEITDIGNFLDTR